MVEERLSRKAAKEAVKGLLGTTVFSTFIGVSSVLFIGVNSVLFYDSLIKEQYVSAGYCFLGMICGGMSTRECYNNNSESRNISVLETMSSYLEDANTPLKRY
ncbi:MAG TPA: hypothetical protein VJJ21_04310 [Candidatus Nanoarchaeia archaeon]|nr:hypothetical protein [Candidatus Nanoarchaeia archaeon]